MVEIRKLLVIEPTNAEAFLLSGRINQRRGDQEAAIAALRTAIFWDPSTKTIDAHILLGRIFLERGDLGEARKYASSAMTLDSANQEAVALQRHDHGKTFRKSKSRAKRQVQHDLPLRLPLALARGFESVRVARQVLKSKSSRTMKLTCPAAITLERCHRCAAARLRSFSSIPPYQEPGQK